MRPKKSDQQVRNLPYVRPEFKEKGSVVELTQQTPKQLGVSDGLVLLNQGPLTNIS